MPEDTESVASFPSFHKKLAYMYYANFVLQARNAVNEARDWSVETLLPGRLSALSSAELYLLGTNLAWWAATRRTSKKIIVLSKVALALSGGVA